MFGQYYRSSEVEEPSFTKKLAGYATWAGIAIVGGSAVRSSGKFQGMLSNIYRGIGEMGHETIQRIGGSASRFAQGSMGSAVRHLLSEESKAYTDGLSGIVTGIVSETIAPKRADIFMSKMRQGLSEDARESFDKIAPKIRSRIHKAMKQNDHRGAKQILLDSEFLDDYNRLLKAGDMQTASRSSMRANIGRAIEDAYEEKINRQIIIEAFSENKNKGVVMSAISKGADQKRKTYQLFDNITPKEGMKELTVADLIDEEGNITELGKRLDKKVQNLAGLGEGESFVGEVQARFNKGLAEAFGDEDKNLNNLDIEFNDLRADFTKKFRQSKVGFVMDEKTQGIVPKAYIGNSVANRGKAILNELSIPILPGAFQVNVGQLFNFMKEDKRFVKNLGRAISQPELLRAGEEFDQSSALIGVGDQALYYDPTNRNMRILDGKYRTLAKRMSPHTAEMAKNRSRSVQNVGEQIHQILEQDSAWKSIKAGLAPDPEDVSALKMKMYNNQHHFFEPVIEDGKVKAIPTDYYTHLGFDKKVVQTLFPDGSNIPVSDLNHVNLKRLLQSQEIEHLPELQSEAALKYLEQAATEPVNLGAFLAQQAKAIDPGDDRFTSIVRNLAMNAENPEDLLKAIEANELFSDEAVDMLKSYDKLFESIEHAGADPEAFVGRQSGEGSFISKMFTNLTGHDTPNTPVLDVQEAILEQIQAAHGMNALKEAKVNKEMIESLRDNLGFVNRSPDEIAPLVGLIEEATGLRQGELGFNQVARSIAAGLVDREGQLSISGMNKLAQMVGAERIQKFDMPDIVRAKILHGQAKNINLLQNQIVLNAPTDVIQAEEAFYLKLADRLHGMTENTAVNNQIKSRFKRRSFTPYRADLELSGGSDYYLVQKGNLFSGDGKTIFDTGMNMVGDIMQSVMSLIDPNSPLRAGSYAATVLGQMSNRLGIEAGLGVGQQDKQTLLRTFTAMGLKRALPLVVGMELYKNINADAEQMGIPGLDDIGANALSNVNLMMASMKDTFGITTINQAIVAGVPGLDQYFSPRSRSEYEEYLAYGDEAVKEGRGWVIGSRNPALGGKVSYFRPNFYRRATSGWKSAENADLANPNYSFLPTLTNPLAPLNLMMNPNWFIEKHKYDRPYMENGLSDKYGTKMGLYGALYGNLTGESGADGGGYDAYLPGRGEGGGPGVGLGSEEGPPAIMIGGAAANINLSGRGFELFDRYREQSGLYGSILKLLPIPEPDGLPTQSVDDAIGMKRLLYMGQYGEALGPYGEFFRRIFGFPDTRRDAYSPYRNNMPSWVPEKYHTGDPYMRTKGPGELMLPGEALERAHPWIRPMKVRGSMVGLSSEEIVQKLLDPMSGEASDYLEYGTYAHLAVQRQLEEEGLLMAAEVPIYDPEHNLSGTIDAVVRGPNGTPRIVEIKTQNDRKFRAGEVPEKYIDQLNFYLGTTNTQEGSIAFVNSDDPSQVRFFEMQYDEERFQRMVERIQSARSKIQGMVDSHLISPYETYDILSRITVLSKVAPFSAELDRLMEKAEGGAGFNAQEQMIYGRLKEQLKQSRQQFQTYSYRDPDLKSISAKVLSVNSDGTITTSEGTIRIAGIQFDSQAFTYEDAEDVLGKFGIRKGLKLNYKVNRGVSDPVQEQRTIAAIVGRVGDRLVSAGYATKTGESDDPMDFSANGQGILSNTIEWIMHRDNMIMNKFLRVRSPLEQFERGEVYGTDFASWSDPIDTLLKPTIMSMIAKDPITSGAQTAIISSLFVTTKAAKKKVAAVTGGIAALLSLARGTKEVLTGETWTPANYRKQGEIDEYYDVLEFIKQTSIAERALQDAYIYEGVNLEVDSETTSQFRYIKEMAERKAKSTMYAFEVSKSTLEDALKSIPFRHRQLAEETILHGSLDEKQRFYDLLPDSEKRVLGEFLGIDPSDLPDKRNLEEFFSDYFLPHSEWSGWNPDQDLGLYSRMTSELENTDIVRPTRTDRAMVAANKEIRIPKYDSPRAGRVRRRIEKLASEINVPITVDISMFPSRSNDVNVNLGFTLDKRPDVDNNVNKDIERA